MANEIPCWDKQRIPAAFSMESCDREVMSYVATTEGINGEMIKDFMAEAFIKTFKRDYVHMNPLLGVGSIIAIDFGLNNISSVESILPWDPIVDS